MVTSSAFEDDGQAAFEEVKGSEIEWWLAGAISARHRQMLSLALAWRKSHKSSRKVVKTTELFAVVPPPTCNKLARVVCGTSRVVPVPIPNAKELTSSGVGGGRRKG